MEYAAWGFHYGVAELGEGNGLRKYSRKKNSNRKKVIGQGKHFERLIEGFGVIF